MATVARQSGHDQSSMDVAAERVKEMHVHDPPQEHIITIRSRRMRAQQLVAVRGACGRDGHLPPDAADGGGRAPAHAANRPNRATTDQPVSRDVGEAHTPTSKETQCNAYS